MPKCSTPFSRNMQNPSNICSLVNPYLASPGLSIMSVPRAKVPPGLKRQLKVLGRYPSVLSRNSMWEISSRLMVAPSSAASRNSSAGVSLEENIISSPLTPTALLSISSVQEEQSQPQPCSFSIPIKKGLGDAFTAKNSLYPLFQENASCSARAFSRIPLSS